MNFEGFRAGLRVPNALIRDMERLGILREVTGQVRWRAYAFHRYLALFVS
jgi:hypothetical protein